jgi:ribosomal protein S13
MKRVPPFSYQTPTILTYKKLAFMEAVIKGLADILKASPNLSEAVDMSVKGLKEAAKMEGVTDEQLQQIEEKINNLLNSKQDLSKAWQSL